ncbi:MAG: zinc-dependent metalloprotease [Planctomycetes bacterium]|nr:zinc-dependent metalloprotease [Planctomycetota bacterium]
MRGVSRALAAASLAVVVGAHGARGQDKKEPEFPEFGTVVKDMETREGFLRLHRRAKDEALLASIPRGLVGQPFFLATSISGGSKFAGWQWEDKLVRFEQRNKQLLLVELNTRQRSKSDSTLAEVVRRTYSDRLIATVDIKALAPDGSFVVDLAGLLAGDYSKFYGSSFSLDDRLARFVKVKTFPKNVEVAVQMPLRGDGTFMTLHYSISELPPEGDYSARPADPRIGYFVTAVRDYSEGDPQEGRMVRYVNRWKVEKADPKLPLSPPKEPIIFYVEKTVPIAYRKAVHEGILEWNRAFEAVGIDGAIVVRQQTDTQFADLDPEDVRYNFFRWITSETPFAMGPSRVDPRNGRILDADIIFDDSMLRVSLRDYAVLIREAPKGLLTGPMADWLERHPHHHPLAAFNRREQDPLLGRARTLLREVARDVPGGALPDLAIGLDGGVKVATTFAELELLPEVVARRQLECGVGEGLPHQLGLMHLAIGDLLNEAAPTGVPLDAFVAEVVKEVVMHEVGHTLGLRHNFSASSWVDLDAINTPDRPAVTSASVMDYHPLNITLATDKPQGRFLTQSIGPYDMLAIQYGYMLDGGDALKAVPRKMAEMGLPYATDEDTRAPDPMIARWDMGNDPIKFARYREALVKKLWETLETRAVQDDESYAKLRRAMDMTIFELGMAGNFVARQVGGLRFARDHKGDPNARPPMQVVDAATQRAALDWVCKHIFAPNAFDIPAELQNKLAASRWYHWGSNDPRQPLDYSLLDRIAQVQGWSLQFLVGDDVLARVWENERRAGKGEALTLPELFDALEAAIFAELAAPKQDATPRSPVVDSARQNLQDAYVRRLIQIALGEGMSPPVANKLAWTRLKALESRFQGVLAGAKLDPYTRAHLESLETRSSKARAAEYVHIASGGCAVARPGPATGPWALVGLAGVVMGVLALRRRAAA